MRYHATPIAPLAAIACYDYEDAKQHLVRSANLQDGEEVVVEGLPDSQQLHATLMGNPRPIGTLTACIQSDSTCPLCSDAKQRILRHACNDALYIWKVGASNPSGVALAIHQHVCTLRDIGTSINSMEWGSVRLMHAQLGSLLRIGDGSYQYEGTASIERDLEFCMQHASPETIQLTNTR